MMFKIPLPIYLQRGLIYKGEVGEYNKFSIVKTGSNIMIPQAGPRTNLIEG
jgi:sRNA-binding regulator protein Hfq